MRVAVMSDSYDNIRKLDLAMPHLRSADVILHCGDLCSPFVIVRLGNGVRGKPVHVVWGSNDGDQRLLTLKALEAGNINVNKESLLG
ncbi:MAG: metallophosphoesterase family protein [Anaerolineales bacterium]